MAVQRLPVRVLALDDDPDDLDILRHHLRGAPELDAELVTTSDPEKALVLARTQAFDLIFLDHQLGRCRGTDVFQSLQLCGVDVPVILVTDQGDEELAVTALHAGMSDYLPKSSVSARSLNRAVKHAIEKHRLAKSLIQSRCELEATLESLRQRNEECQSFYHTLSHELKTPLTAAREFVAIVLDELQGPLTDAQRASLTRVLGCCDHMTILMNDILDSARLDTHKLSLQPRSYRVDELVRQSVALCTPFAKQRDVLLRSSVGSNLDLAVLDPQRIEQVLTNLINNAIKYSPSGAYVDVSANLVAEASDAIEFAVADHGCGIHPDKLPHVFERLYQAQSDDATVRGGLGLGLYLCRQLVELHGGRIAAESEPGSGSKFRFTLPLLRDAATPPANA